MHNLNVGPSLIPATYVMFEGCLLTMYKLPLNQLLLHGIDDLTEESTWTIAWCFTGCTTAAVS